MSEHIDVEELADAAEGLLPSERAGQVGQHLQSCAACRATAELLASVSDTLAAEPVPAMPAAVAARLDRVVADEQIRRALETDVPAGVGGPGSGSSPSSDSATVLSWAPRPRLPDRPVRGAHRGRAAGRVLLAAAVATLVGFGGYVVSARAGLNEPPNDVAAVNSSSLRNQARELEQSQDLDPHRFSRAWSCARRATDGRITGLASITWNGDPALLVYLRTAQGAQAAAVTGCDGGTPRVVGTVPLPR